MLDKFYLKAVPTVVVAESSGDIALEESMPTNDAESDQDEVWDQMEGAESDTETKNKHMSKKRKA